jgi:hypothetical protein
VKLTADVSLRQKITHAPMKLTITAAQDKKLLNPFERRVKAVISAALISGGSKTIQGKLEFIGLSPRITRMGANDQKETGRK